MFTEKQKSRLEKRIGIIIAESDKRFERQQNEKLISLLVMSGGISQKSVDRRLTILS